MAKHNEIGKIGERMAKTFLMKQGFNILATNERIRYGEIDIIAKKSNVLHFVEVKSVEVKNIHDISNLLVKPEDNLTFQKRTKLKRTIEIYLANNNYAVNKSKAVIDLACVYINTENKEGRVKFIENIEL